MASSHTGATRLTASGAVDVTSTKTQVLVASPRKVLLTAAGAAVQIDAGSITISAPGAVRFRAAMKVLTGAGHASVECQKNRSGKVSPVDFDDAFVITNDAGAPFANRRYEITREDGGILRGITDANGRIQQQVSFRGERVKVNVEGKA